MEVKSPAELIRESEPVDFTTSVVGTKQKKKTDKTKATGKRQTPTTRRAPRCCQQDGCDKAAVARGFCTRHGGATPCSIEDCGSRAQNHGLCWKHGGYNMCTFDGCKKRAKSRGLCWSHGGGTKCKQTDCTTVAISRGLCWAHGGGKRCQLSGCLRPGYHRYANFCVEHFHSEHSAGARSHFQLAESNKFMN